MNRLTLALCLAAFLAAAACARGTRQPHMSRALELLDDARTTLENATADKGGHRIKALEEIRLASEQVRAGIDFDEAH